MVSFYTPAYLWLLLLIPIIIYLHLRPSRKRQVAISDSMMWEESRESASPGRARMIKSNILKSLLFSILTVLLYSSALSSPFVSSLTPPKRNILLMLNDTVELKSMGISEPSLLSEAEDFISKELTYRDSVTIMTKSGIVIHNVPPGKIADAIAGLDKSKLSNVDLSKLDISGYDYALKLPRSAQITGNIGFVDVLEHSTTLYLTVKSWFNETVTTGVYVNGSAYKELEIMPGSTKTFDVALNSVVTQVRLDLKDTLEEDNIVHWVSRGDPATIIVIVSEISDSLLNMLVKLTAPQSSVYEILPESFDEIYRQYRQKAVYILNKVPLEREYDGRFLHIAAIPKHLAQYLAAPVAGSSDCFVLGPHEPLFKYRVDNPLLFTPPAGSILYSACTNHSPAFMTAGAGSVHAVIGFSSKDIITIEPAYALLVRRALDGILRFSHFKPNYSCAESVANTFKTKAGISISGPDTAIHTDERLISFTPQRSGLYEASLGELKEIFAVNYFSAYEWSDIKLPAFQGRGEALLTDITIEQILLIMASIFCLLEILLLTRQA